MVRWCRRCGFEPCDRPRSSSASRSVSSLLMASTACVRPRARHDEVRLGVNGNALVASKLPGPVNGSNVTSSSISSPKSPMRRPMSSYDGIDLHDVAPHAKRAPRELMVVAFVLNLDELAQQLVAVHLLRRARSGTMSP